MNIRQTFFLSILCFVQFLTASSDTAQRPKLTDVLAMNPNIRAHIFYATEENFTKKAVYPKNARVYLLEQVAQALNKVQSDVEKDGLGLLIWDGYRPLPVQEIFWSICPDTNYVADPKKGSKHNRGAAVDVTLVDLKTGNYLNMPTPFDDFSKKAWRDAGEDLGVSQAQMANRKKLGDVMQKHGFRGLDTEWWHFDWSDVKEHIERYPILNITFDELEKESHSTRNERVSSTI